MADQTTAYPEKQYPPPQQAAGYAYPTAGQQQNVGVPPPYAAAPPPYPAAPQPYPAAPQPVIPSSVNNNNVVVASQPAVTTSVQIGRSNYGSGPMMFAIIVSACIFFCGEWWGLICSLAGVFLAFNASSQAAAGDEEAAKRSVKLSIGFTVGGIVASVVGVIILLAVIITQVTATVNRFTDNNNGYVYYG